MLCVNKHDRRLRTRTCQIKPTDETQPLTVTRRLTGGETNQFYCLENVRIDQVQKELGAVFYYPETEVPDEAGRVQPVTFLADGENKQFSTEYRAVGNDEANPLET